MIFAFMTTEQQMRMKNAIVPKTNHKIFKGSSISHLINAEMKERRKTILFCKIIQFLKISSVSKKGWPPNFRSNDFMFAPIASCLKQINLREKIDCKHLKTTVVA